MWMLQYKTEHVSVILQENFYSTWMVVRRKLANGFLLEESLSQGTVESPLALNSVKTWVGISLYSFMIFVLDIVGWNFHREPFRC